jgi:hypothetical protein
MINILITFNFLSGQTRHSVLTIEDYEFLKSAHDDLNEKLFDDTFWGNRPYSVTIDLYQDADITFVPSKPGSIEFLLGQDEAVVEGQMIERIITL